MGGLDVEEAGRWDSEGELVPSASMRWRLFFIGLMVAITCWASRHYAVDDALIYARYIRNALDGYGLVYNHGERVNALTSPFFTILLLAASWLLHGRIMLAEFCLYGVFLAAACAIAERLVPWSGLVIAGTSYFYSCLGMETSLFLCMLSLLTVLYLEGRLNWIPLVAVLTMLTRFEGGALVAIIAYQLTREKRRPSLRSYLPAVCVLAALLTFNHMFYGSWLPASTTAKFGQGFSGYWGKWPTAFLQVGPLKTIFRRTKYLVPVAMALAAWGMWKEGSSKMNLVLLPFCLGLALFYILFNLPAYHWYYAPFIFFIVVYSVRGIPRGLATPVCAIAIVALTFGNSIYWMNKTTGLQPGGLTTYIDLAAWIRGNTAPDAKIAALEIGTLGFYDDRYMVDMLGLTNPANARRLLHHDLYSWLEDQKPDYVVVHQQPVMGEFAAAQSQNYAYLPVHFGAVYLMKRKGTPR